MSNQKLSTEQFIADCQLKHGNRYDYTYTIYNGKDKNVNIRCREHGQFVQAANNHRLRGMGCPTCAKIKSAKRSQQTALDAAARFQLRAHAMHEGRYDYGAVQYQTNKTPVQIQCQKHGSFWQTPSNHLKGMGCIKCKRDEDKRRSHAMALDARARFVVAARKVHGNQYTYEQTQYVDNKTPVLITCSRHGVFRQKPTSHLSLGRGCARCRASAVENSIARWLDSRAIAYQREVRIREFNPHKRFDFYLPEYSLYMEYDGEFHTLPIMGTVRLQQQQERDRLRNLWCATNNVQLLVLPAGYNLNDLELRLQRFKR